MVPLAGNHFEPSTSAIPSCLPVSSPLKFVVVDSGGVGSVTVLKA